MLTHVRRRKGARGSAFRCGSPHDFCLARWRSRSSGSRGVQKACEEQEERACTGRRQRLLKDGAAQAGVRSHGACPVERGRVSPDRSSSYRGGDDGEPHSSRSARRRGRRTCRHRRTRKYPGAEDEVCACLCPWRHGAHACACRGGRRSPVGWSCDGGLRAPPGREMRAVCVGLLRGVSSRRDLAPLRAGRRTRTAPRPAVRTS